MSGSDRTAESPRFLIIRLGSLGDVIHGIPAAAALRRQFPHGRIDWLVDRKYVPLLDLVEGLDRKIPFDPRDLTRGAGAWSAVSDLRGTHYDAALVQGVIIEGMQRLACQMHYVVSYIDDVVYRLDADSSQRGLQVHRTLLDRDLLHTYRHKT